MHNLCAFFCLRHGRLGGPAPSDTYCNHCKGRIRKGRRHTRRIVLRTARTRKTSCRAAAGRSCNESQRRVKRHVNCQRTEDTKGELNRQSAAAAPSGPVRTTAPMELGLDQLRGRERRNGRSASGRWRMRAPVFLCVVVEGVYIQQGAFFLGGAYTQQACAQPPPPPRWDRAPSSNWPSGPLRRGQSRGPHRGSPRQPMPLG
jgi:hypothetical protein